MESARRPRPARGFTLVELMIVVVIIGTLAAISVPVGKKHIENARNAAAMLNLRLLEDEIMAFRAAQGFFPPDLAAIGRANFLDPWENPFSYLPIDGYKPNPGQLRKDLFLVPINSDYDLYSIGTNGMTAIPLNTPQGKDDIIRANNGSFIGLAKNF